MNIDFYFVFNDRHFGEAATSSIAHFSAPLDCVSPPINVKDASSSRLAKDAEKYTLEPVQQGNLG